MRSENEKNVDDLFKSAKNGEEDNKEVFEEKKSLFSFVKAKEERNEEEEENNGEEKDWVINKGFGRREEEEEERRKEIREDGSQSNLFNNFYENNNWNNNNDGQFKFWQWKENYMPKMGGGRWWEMWGREENDGEESNNKVFNWNGLMENKWKIGK
ncbi:unnamed protein product [Meloidogyne enterolobii]|uniref:Uncharacterized protein n=1 Tax=Meloidogyne enterolobii TaxID=390850 RepID=A0ACB1B4K4_MELEN